MLTVEVHQETEIGIPRIGGQVSITEDIDAVNIESKLTNSVDQNVDVVISEKHRSELVEERSPVVLTNDWVQMFRGEEMRNLKKIIQWMKTTTKTNLSLVINLLDSEERKHVWRSAFEGQQQLLAVEQELLDALRFVGTVLCSRLRYPP